MFDSFWPPQVGDVWLGVLNQEAPWPVSCRFPGELETAGVTGSFPADIVWGSRGPLRLVWRNGEAVTANHVDELDHAAVNVEVTTRDDVHYYAGIRQINASGFDIWPDAANLEPGVLRVGPGAEVKFLTDAEIEQIAYDANERAADQKER